MTRLERQQYNKEYYKAHKEEILAQQKDYYKDNKEKRLQYAKINKDKLNKQKKQRRHEDIEKTRQINRDYYNKNKERINARRKELRDSKKMEGK